MHSRIQIFPLTKEFSVSPPPYYLYWFDRFYPNATINWNGVPFFLQLINGIQEIKVASRQWNWLLDAVVKILRYKKSTIYHEIYIKVFSDGTVSFLTVYTDDFLNTTDGETEFPALRRVFE